MRASRQRMRAMVALAGAVALLSASVVEAPAVLGAFASSGAASATLGTATLAPATNPSAANAGCSLLTFSIKVSWTPSISSAVDGYRVAIGTTSGGPYPTVANVSGNSASSATFTGLAGATRYYGIVTATRAGWTSPSTSEVSVLTPALCL